jgi:hypothetical protein
MGKVAVFLLLTLFVVGFVIFAVYDENGVQSDMVDMKNNTQGMMQDANDTMENYGGVTP